MAPPDGSLPISSLRLADDLQKTEASSNARRHEGPGIVTLSGTLSGQQDATEPRQDDSTERDRIPTVDLAPLTDLIDDLTRRNADLAAAAAMWQTRAAHLENELKQLTVGIEVPTDVAETAGETLGSSQRDVPVPSGVADGSDCGTARDS